MRDRDEELTSAELFLAAAFGAGLLGAILRLL
jgi:hypothetical protein